ncbi:MAG: polysaccharide deacetylase family protein [Pyrinomonadaceae bacterium]
MFEFFKENLEFLLLTGATLITCLGIAWAIVYNLTYAVRSQTLGKTIWQGSANSNLVALTFDDGPAPETLEILDILRAENIKATFFLIGERVEKYPEIARQIALDGHRIGNHSYSHPIFLFCGAGKTKRELENTQKIIKNVTNITPKLARSPCGVRSAAYFSAAKKLNLQTVQWSDAGFDWKNITAEKIAQSVLKTARNNSIILLHDGDSAGKSDRRATVEAIPLILRGLAEKDLKVAPLAEMLGGERIEQFQLREKTT